MVEGDDLSIIHFVAAGPGQQVNHELLWIPKYVRVKCEDNLNWVMQQDNDPKAQQHIYNRMAKKESRCCKFDLDWVLHRMPFLKEGFVSLARIKAAPFSCQANTSATIPLEEFTLEFA